MLAATIAAIVEKQIAKHTQTIAALQAQVSELSRRLEGQTHGEQVYHGALQTAVEERLAAFANAQQAQIADIEHRLHAMPQVLQSELPTHLEAATQTLAAGNAQRHQAVVAEVAEMRTIVARVDEQTSAIVNHVNETSAALAKRMDDGDQTLATAVEQRLQAVKAALDTMGPEVQRQVTEQSASLVSKMEYVESSTTDRMLAMEARINEQQGTRMADLEATIGRIGSGFDDSMVAFNQRLLDLDNRSAEVSETIGSIHDKVAAFDPEAFEAVKEQISSAIGETMLVRIEVDRYVANSDEKINKHAIRMAEIEALLDDNQDVSTAVQLERLDELERAMAMVDPTQYVLKSDMPGMESKPTAATQQQSEDDMMAAIAARGMEPKATEPVALAAEGVADAPAAPAPTPAPQPALGLTPPSAWTTGSTPAVGGAAGSSAPSLTPSTSA